jgi:hypothetical protein
MSLIALRLGYIVEPFLGQEGTLRVLVFANLATSVLLFFQLFGFYIIFRDPFFL